MGRHWVVMEQDEQTLAEQRERDQAAEIMALERAIADDHRRRDDMMASSGRSGFGSSSHREARHGMGPKA